MNTSPSDQPDPGASRRRSEWRILGIALLVFAAILAYRSQLEHARLLDEEGERLSTQARVVQQHVEKQLDATNRALNSVRSRLPVLTGDSPAEASRELSTLVDALDAVRTMLVLDVEGKVIATSRPELAGKDFRERDYFNAPRQKPNAATLYVSPPFRSALGIWTFNVSRAVIGPAGEFGGVVAASVDTDELAFTLDSVRYTADMWTALSHGDGVVFLFRPDMGKPEGIDVGSSAESFLSRHRAANSPATVLRGVPQVTGTDTLMAQRTLQPDSLHMDKPLIVAAARPISAILATWQGDLIKRSIVFLVLTAFGATTLILVQRQRRERDAQAAMAATEKFRSDARFREVFDSISDAIYIHDAETGAIIDVNRRMLDMFRK